jgi:hypothetical protein
MAAKFMSLRNLRFLLYEIFDLASLTRHDYYHEYDRKMLDMILQAASELAERLLWPLVTTDGLTVEMEESFFSD